MVLFRAKSVPRGWAVLAGLVPWLWAFEAVTAPSEHSDGGTLTVVHPGEGLADATAVLQAAFDSRAHKVIVPNVGHPWVVEPLTIRRDGLEIVLDPGVVLLAKPGSFKGVRDALLTFEGVRDVIVRGQGASLRMQRDDYEGPEYIPSEWRHAVVLRGTHRVEIEGLSIFDAGGDGVYLGRGASPHESNDDIFIHHVIVDHGLRQGISVISARGLRVEDSAFLRAGPKPPAAGIDIEPNRPDEFAQDIVVRRCFFIDNEGIGMHVWLRHLDATSAPVSILLEHNTVVGGRLGIHGTGAGEGGARGYVDIRHSTVMGVEGAGIRIRRHGPKGVDVRFDHGLVGCAGSSAIALEGMGPERGVFGTLWFEHLAVVMTPACNKVLVLEGRAEHWSSIRGSLLVTTSPTMTRGAIEFGGLPTLQGLVVEGDVSAGALATPRTSFER